MRERRRSTKLFTQAMQFQLLLGIITIVTVFILVNNIIGSHQREKIGDLNSSQLWRVGSDVDTRLESMEQWISRTLTSNDGITLMVTTENADSDCTHRILNSLSGYVEENILVSRVLFYLPTTNLIYTSAGNVLPLANAGDRSDVEAYLAVRELGRARGSEISYRILNLQGSLYLAGDFCVPNFIGAVLIRIDVLQLNMLMQGEMERSDGRFFLMDGEQQAILFSADIMDKAQGDLEAERYYDVVHQIGDRDSDVYLYHSQVTGLYYGLLNNWTDVSAPLTRILLLMIPVILVYTVLTGLYSLWLSRKVYQPIAKLMQMAMGRRDQVEVVNRHRYQNELDYLEAAFRDAWGENQQQRELLASISQDVVEHMFRGILIGKNVEPGYVESTMQGLGLEEFKDGRYLVIAGCIVPDSDREMTSMEMGMCRRSLMSYLAEQESDDHILIPCFMDTTLFAIVCCYHQDASATHMKESAANLLQGMTALAGQLPYSLHLGLGKSYSEIDSIRLSWHDAYTQMEYMRYVNGESLPANISSKEEAVDYDRTYFAERGEALAEIAEKDRREAAEEMAAAILKETLSFDKEKCADCIRMLVDILVQKMIAVHVEADTVNSIRQHLERVLRTQGTTEGQEEIQAVFSQAIYAINTSSRRSRYRYVDSAKEYIAAHYSDGNLSLNEVSDAVGISAPYLSGIFSEAEQVGFSAYLSNFRVERAKQFLEQTTMNVTDIGYKCGFNSAQSFSRVFKKNTGFTPGQYRDYSRRDPVNLDDPVDGGVL